MNIKDLTVGEVDEAYRKNGITTTVKGGEIISRREEE